MKRLHELAWIAILAGPLLLAGAPAGADEAEKDDGLDVFFRDTDVEALSKQALEIYGEADPGDGVLLERSFPEAPPQIPHNVDDMLPILADDNECLNCHHPENAESKKDAPVPESHFKRPVMGKGPKGSGMAWAVKGYEDAPDKFSQRYDCVMCHAPQARNVKDVKSTFVRVEKAATDKGR